MTIELGHLQTSQGRINERSIRSVDFSDVRNRWRIQPVDATHSLNISAGVWKPSVLRGLSFNCCAIALS